MKPFLQALALMLAALPVLTHAQSSPSIPADNIGCNPTNAQGPIVGCANLPSGFIVGIANGGTGGTAGNLIMSATPSNCSADVSGQVQTQLNAATASSQTLIVPAGCYRFDNPVTAPSGSSVIQAMAPGTATFQAGVGNTASALLFKIAGIVNSTNVTGFIIDSVTLDGGMPVAGAPPNTPGTGTDANISQFTGSTSGTTLTVTAISNGTIYAGATVFDTTGALANLGSPSLITLSGVNLPITTASLCLPSCTVTMSASAGTVSSETMYTTNHTQLLSATSVLGFGSTSTAGVQFGCSGFILRNLTVQNVARTLGNFAGCNNSSFQNVTFNNTGAGGNDYIQTSNLPFMSWNAAALQFTPSSSTGATITLPLSAAACGIYYLFNQDQASNPNLFPTIADITNPTYILNNTVITGVSGASSCSTSGGTVTFTAGSMVLTLSQTPTSSVASDSIKVYDNQAQNNRVTGSTFTDFGSGTIDIAGQYNFQCTGNRWFGNYALGNVTNTGGGNSSCYEQGSNLPGNLQTLVSGNTVYGMTGNGLDINCGSGTVISDNTVIGSGRAGISLSSNATASSENPLCTMQDVTVSGNVVKDSNYSTNAKYQTGTAVTTATGVATVGTITGTATNGTYTAVTLTGGSGSGAKATVVVAGGSVTAVTITTAGSAYLVGDSLGFTVTGGTGTAVVAKLGQVGTVATPITSVTVSSATGTCATGNYVSAQGFAGYPITGGANNAGLASSNTWASPIALSIGYVGILASGTTLYCNNRSPVAPGSGVQDADLVFGVSPSSAVATIQDVTIGSNVLGDDQFAATPTLTLTTTGASAGAVTLAFSSTTGVVVGQQMYCPGAQPSSVVTAFTSGAVTINLPLEQTVSSGTSCYFYAPQPTTLYGIDAAPNMTVNNIMLANGALSIYGAAVADLSPTASKLGLHPNPQKLTGNLNVRTGNGLGTAVLPGGMAKGDTKSFTAGTFTSSTTFNSTQATFTPADVGKYIRIQYAGGTEYSASVLTLVSGGTGYSVGDLITVTATGGSGISPQFQVASVNGSGTILTYAITVNGYYSAAPSGTLNTTGGTGGNTATVTATWVLDGPSFLTTIASVTDANDVVLASAVTSTTTNTGARFWYGSDDTAAVAGMISYANAHNLCAYFPAGAYWLVTQSASMNLSNSCLLGVGQFATGNNYAANGSVIMLEVGYPNGVNGSGTTAPAFSGPTTTLGNGTYTLRNLNGVLVSGLTFFWPNQDGTGSAPIQYPALFGGEVMVSFTLQDSYVVNAWDLFKVYSSVSGSSSGRMYISRDKFYCINTCINLLNGGADIWSVDDQVTESEGFFANSLRPIPMLASYTYDSGAFMVENILPTLQAATLVSGGNGYTVGDTLTFVGGTVLTGYAATQLTVATISGGGATGPVATFTVAQAGNYWPVPSGTITTTGGTGSGATFTAFWNPGYGSMDGYRMTGSFIHGIRYGMRVQNGYLSYANIENVQYDGVLQPASFEGTAAAYANFTGGSIFSHEYYGPNPFTQNQCAFNFANNGISHVTVTGMTFAYSLGSALCVSSTGINNLNVVGNTFENWGATETVGNYFGLDVNNVYYLNVNGNTFYGPQSGATSQNNGINTNGSNSTGVSNITGNTFYDNYNPITVNNTATAGRINISGNVSYFTNNTNALLDNSSGTTLVYDIGNFWDKPSNVTHVNIQGSNTFHGFTKPTAQSGATHCGVSGVTVANGSSDSAGQVTFGSGTTNTAGCLITFYQPHTNAPDCHATDQTTTADILTAPASTTGLTITGTVVASDVVTWACSFYQ